MTAFSLTVAQLDDARHADELYGLLLPFADRRCVVGGAVLCLGPVSAVLGIDDIELVQSKLARATLG